MPSTDAVTVPIKGNDGLTATIKGINAEFASFGDKIRSFTDGFTDIRSAIGLVGDAFNTAKQVYAETVGATLKYSDTVRQMGRISGQSSTEVSRLIQLTDDLGVETNDLKTAMEGAARKGIRITTESIAQLADQYVRLQDPVARNSLLLDNFGRSGLNMAAAMEKGGDAIRKMAAEVDKNLILTDAQVKQARALEIAQDNLNDSITGIKIKAGSEFVPALTDMLTATTNMANEGNLLVNVIKGIPAIQALIYGGAVLEAQGHRMAKDAMAEEGKAAENLTAAYGKTYKSLKDLYPERYGNVYQSHNPGYTFTGEGNTIKIKQDATLNVKISTVGPQSYGDLGNFIQKTIRDMQAAGLIPKATR